MTRDPLGTHALEHGWRCCILDVEYGMKAGSISTRQPDSFRMRYPVGHQWIGLFILTVIENRTLARRQAAATVPA